MVPGSQLVSEAQNYKAVTKKSSELKCPKKLYVYSSRTEYFMSYE